MVGELYSSSGLLTALRGCQMRSTVLRLVVILVTVSLLVGCSNRKNIAPLPSIDEEAKSNIEKPVNCSTAWTDINVLENEKASVGKKALAGVRSVFPIAAAAGILMGDYRDRVSVATGQYNRDIEAKILQIQKACGMR